MKLMILDGNSIINRAYFGIRALSAPDGTPTNALYGFISIFERIYSDIMPDAVAVCFDVHSPTFRHRAVESYKQGRKPMPEDLCAQMPVMKEILTGMGINYYELAGYEADDILGTAARICEEENWECVVVTGDKDSLQLVSDSVSVCIIKSRMGQTETVLYTPDVFRGEYGFEPSAMVDLKALMGDSSDNISGVPGIGEKTAMELLRRCGTLDAIYSELDSLDIKESVRRKLADGEKSARQSFWLATILKEVPLEFKPEHNIWHEDYRPELFPLFKRLNFNRFIEKHRLYELSSCENDGGQGCSDLRNAPEIKELCDADIESFSEKLKSAEYVSVLADSADSFTVCCGSIIYKADRFSCFLSFDEMLTVLYSSEVKKTGHNIKDLMRILFAEGIRAEGFAFDTALAAYILVSTDSDFSLPNLAEKYLGFECEDSEAAYLLYPVLEKKLREKGLDRVYYSAELPLCEVLASMENKGFLVDRQALHNFGDDLSRNIDVLQKSIYKTAGYEFNINSPKQLGVLLFEELKLPYGKKTKTGWSTNADVLDKLRGLNPVVDDILEYRILTKLKSTYTDGLQKVIASDGRIHTNFKMTVTATGRLSSTEPNLQNIPIRKELGSQIREMFIAPAGSVLVDADYSQIELRLLAHISNDENMISAFKSGEDFHKLTASKVFNVPVDEVSPLMRSRAKAVNFGIVYGISAFSLSQDIGVSVKDAKAYMDAYFDQYRGVAEYMTKVIENAGELGYVSTLYGRRRDLPELSSMNHNIRSFGERVALNMPVQGTAADIIKLAMVKAYITMRERGLKAELVLQVHDELIVECPEEEKDEVSSVLKESMENAVSLSVPLTVEVNCGRNWAEAH